MYGELTLRINPSCQVMSEPFHGRNARLREHANTSFSGVGHLRRTPCGAAVKLYENAFAAYPLPFDAIPGCIEVVRVELVQTD